MVCVALLAPLAPLTPPNPTKLDILGGAWSPSGARLTRTGGARESANQMGDRNDSFAGVDHRNARPAAAGDVRLHGRDVRQPPADPGRGPARRLRGKPPAGRG